MHVQECKPSPCHVVELHISYNDAYDMHDIAHINTFTYTLIYIYIFTSSYKCINIQNISLYTIRA